MHIHTLTADAIRPPVLQDLCVLLGDAVAGGASVGWVTIPSTQEATAYWHSVADQVQRGALVLLVARDATQVIGTVQLHLAGRPNGAHRAEVARLLVHSRARRRGVGAALMAALEVEARQHGVSLLVLDTRTGDPSQHLYEKLGYTLAGIIPHYALSTTGVREPTAIMYKVIGAVGPHPAESGQRTDHGTTLPRGT